MSILMMPRFAGKDEEKEPEHIKRRQQRGSDREPKEEARPVRPGGGQNFVLAEKAGE